jgi:hypothetical protein
MRSWSPTTSANGPLQDHVVNVGVATQIVTRLAGRLGGRLGGSAECDEALPGRGRQWFDLRASRRQSPDAGAPVGTCA